MFRGRRQLQRRDRESGLAFNWRVPVSSTGSLVLAILLVACLAAVLATTVRVKIGSGTREEPEQGTLVVVPCSGAGQWLERRAVEAGPFPSRWNPAADPAYVALRRQALRAATDSGVPYRPELAPLDLKPPELDEAPGFRGGVFPPLPRSTGEEIPDEPREVVVGVRVLDAGTGVSFNHAVLPLPAASAGEAIGGRYMVEYDGEGRVLDVVALSPRRRQPAVVQWLSRGLVTGDEGHSGWLSVETVAAR